MHRARRRALRRPLHWVVVAHAVGSTFMMLGLTMVGGDPEHTGVFHWDAAATGVLCFLLGVTFSYAFAWVPRVWIVGDELFLRRLVGPALRFETRGVPRSEIAAISTTERGHDTLPLNTVSPVLSLTTGENLELDGHRRYVMPWASTNSATGRDVALLQRWAAGGQS